MNTRLLLAPMLIAAAAATPLAAAQAATVKLSAALNGTGGATPADPDGDGAFAADVDADAGDFCYTLTVAKIAKPTMAHVHTGAAGSNGPPVITVGVTGASDECVAVEPDVLKAIVANPAGYYVNVHTADFPAGAIRGQLATK